MLAAAKRIQRDGGTLRYVAMDEPIFFSTVYAGQHAVHWTPDEAAANAAQNIKALLAEFPEVKFGDIEPLVDVKSLASFPDLISRYQEGIRAFRKALGVPLAFFDADIDWNSPSFPANLIALHKMVAGEGLPFGIIYDGDSPDKSDASWIHSAERHLKAAEQNITPDCVIFQSWHAYPKKLLPETDPDSFTWMLAHYAPPASSK